MLRYLITVMMLMIKTAYGQAQGGPTMVEAIANTPSGDKNIAIINQPDNLVNPLGNPIVGPYVAPKAYNAADGLDYENYSHISAVAGQSNIDESLPQQAQELGQDFKNTLMEANGEVYDVQSYPIEDIGVMGNNADPQTIYSPNVNQ